MSVGKLNAAKNEDEEMQLISKEDNEDSDEIMTDDDTSEE